MIEQAKEKLIASDRKEAGENLQRRVSARIIGDTDIITIKVTGATAALAREGAWAISNAYKNYRQDRAQEQSRRVLSFLEEQVTRAEAEVDAAEQAVRDYQNEVGIISLDNEASKLNDQLTELESQLLITDITIQENRLRLQQVEEKNCWILGLLSGDEIIVTGQLIERLQNQLADLEAKKNWLFKSWFTGWFAGITIFK